MSSLVLQQSINGVVLACDYTLFALGLSVTWGVLKVLNIAHAELFTAGALVAIYVGLHTGLPLYAIIPIAAVGCGVAAVAVDAVAFWPLRMQKLDVSSLELTSLISSLGISGILVAIANKVTNNQIRPLPGRLGDVRSWKLGSLHVTNIQVVVTATALALTIATWFLVQRTQFGRGLRALAASREMASVMGIRVNAMYRYTMFGCGALAGVAGVLLTLLTGNADSYSGENLLLKGIAIIVLAGSGQILGLLVGGLFLGFGETVGTLYLPTMVQTALPFLLILFVLLMRPTGLFGRSETVRV